MESPSSTNKRVQPPTLLSPLIPAAVFSPSHKWSSVAQLVEHGTCNAKVVGSIPGTTHTQKCMHA
ncbi:hypothetical protein J4Q44_G00078080 [Coregonus suidteri]|uniref:Uncharacterized protein n=1 Tax=Coregonus suidteri TaxID=861788 RepID=A0AAN8M7N6_9TELE